MNSRNPTYGQVLLARSQRGIALITVLMVFAIATIVATKVIVAKNVDTNRVTGMVDRTQAHYYALLGEQLAIMVLEKDDESDRDNNTLADSLEEFWAGKAIPYPIDSFSTIVVTIVDLNRFYNLNNLIQDDGNVNEQELERFKLLLTELDLDEELAENLQDWLDEDDKETGYLSESDAYENFEPGYLAANRPLRDISELRLVNGFEPEVIDKLAPHVTVVPDYWGVLPLNLNTATSYSLATMFQSSGSDTTKPKGISLSGARNIESNRPYDSMTDFNNAAPIVNPVAITVVNPDSSANAGRYTKNIARYGVTSTHFEINVRADYAGHVSYLTSIVTKGGGGNSATYKVLQRKETDNSQRFLR